MADQDQGPDKSSLDYWQSLTGERRTPPRAPAAPPPRTPAGPPSTALQGAQNVPTAAMAAPGAPENQWLSDPSNPLAQFARAGAMEANQFGIGMLGVPAFAGRTAWNAARLAAPSMGEPPGWMDPQVYGNALTIGGLTPQNPEERILASGARSAGTAFTVSGPGGALIAAGAGMGGQAAREAGYDTAGDIIDIAGGVLGARSFAGRASIPARVAGRPLTAAAPSAATGFGATPLERSILRTIVVEPIAHMIHPLAGLALNAGVAYGRRMMGMPTWSGAAIAGAKLLGGGMVGKTMADEGIPGGTEWQSDGDIAMQNLQ